MQHAPIVDHHPPLVVSPRAAPSVMAKTSPRDSDKNRSVRADYLSFNADVTSPEAITSQTE